MPLPTLQELLAEKAALEITDASLCKEAGIDVTTFGRWKRGEFSPQMETWEKVVEALARIKAAREATA